MRIPNMCTLSYHGIQKSALKVTWRQIHYTLMFVIYLMVASPVWGQEIDTLEIARKLQSTYENAANVVASFKQTTTMKISSRHRRDDFSQAGAHALGLYLAGLSGSDK